MVVETSGDIRVHPRSLNHEAENPPKNKQKTRSSQSKAAEVDMHLVCCMRFLSEPLELAIKFSVFVARNMAGLFTQRIRAFTRKDHDDHDCDL